MSAPVQLLSEQVAISAWSREILLRADAIQECEAHLYLVNRHDADALEKAKRAAQNNPYPGLTPDEAARRVEDQLNKIGDTCPGCEKNQAADHDSDRAYFRPEGC
jgi:hypothetical protein